MSAWEIRYGDCLDLLPDVETESVDLVYLDPPFNTGKTWTTVTSGVALSFEDRFPDLASYVSYIEDRCRELHRVLKPAGSLWLHQDPHHGVSYLRLMLDEVFGIDNSRGEIVWKRTAGQTNSSRTFVRVHDTILIHAKSDETVVSVACNDANPCACTGVWLDCPGPPPKGERLGYPTQKPEALLDRIVGAGSPPGGLVLDPFCGSGTTLAAAVKSGGRAIGLDQSADACRVAAERLRGIERTMQPKLFGEAS